MDTFPSSLNINNKSGFNREKCEYYKKILRQKIFEHIIENNEEDFFDISKFNKTHVNDEIMCETIFSQIIDELSELGWKYKISFGGTGVFFYSTENPPSKAW